MSFSSDIARLTEQYRRRLNYVAKTATLAVCNEARTPTAQGGRMPVDTSNLRHSMVASTMGVPSGPSTGNEGKAGDDVAATIIRWQPGQTPFWAGFAAIYARPMEARYGYMRGATERWQDHVNKAVAEAKRKKL